MTQATRNFEHRVYEAARRRRKKFLEDVQAWVNEQKSDLGLGDWLIEVTPDLPGAPNDDKCRADVEATYGSRCAALRVADEMFIEDSDDENTHTLVHELMHLHVDRPYQHLHDALRAAPSVSTELTLVILAAHRLEVEYLVDKLADVVTPCTPVFKTSATTMRTR